MTLVWKNNQNVKEIKTVIKEKPPRAFVEKVERWCPYNNAETVGNKKKIDKHLLKPQAQFLIKFLQENNLQKFEIKTLINLMNAWNFTDGSLQRKILSLLVCKGIIKKQMIEYLNKKGNTKFKMIYSVNESPLPCPSLNEEGNCKYSWKNARTTKYFTKSYEN